MSKETQDLLSFIAGDGVQLDIMDETAAAKMEAACYTIEEIEADAEGDARWIIRGEFGLFWSNDLGWAPRELATELPKVPLLLPVGATGIERVTK